jgi:hypothetical protein
MTSRTWASWSKSVTFLISRPIDGGGHYAPLLPESVQLTEGQDVELQLDRRQPRNLISLCGLGLANLI